MSLYRLQRFASGDGDPIDSSDANSILQEFEKMKRERYNVGLDTAKLLVVDIVQEDVVLDTLLDALENSKI